MKYIRIFAAFICILLLSACNETPVTTQPVTTMPDLEESTIDIPEDTTVLVSSNENLYSVSMPVTTQQDYDENGNLIFHYDYQTLHLILPDIDVADKVIIDFLNRVEYTRDDAELIREHALQVAAGSTLSEPYSYQIQYNTTRIDQGVLSFFGQVIQSGDAMHSNRQCISANYDLVTGDVLTLGSILYRADSKDALTELVLKHLQTRQDELYENFEEIVRQRFSGDESIDEAFYFNTYGLCFFFSPYEIAPYSVGIVTAQIPYEDLTGVIGDAYFPAEKTYANGIVSISAFDAVNLNDYEQFSEIIIDADAPMYLISVQGGVQDVMIDRIYQLGYVNTVYAANVLSETTAILLQTDLSAEDARYLLSYTSSGDFFEFELTPPDPVITFTN